MTPVKSPNTDHRAITFSWRLAQAEFIRQARMERGLSQEELAARATGCTKQAISAIEAGRIQVAPQDYRSFADVLGIPRETFARVILRYQNPWLYLDLFGPDMRLEAELEYIPKREWRRPRRDRQPPQG